MPRNSKKSSSTKNHVTFVLGHRSQKDPLAADEDAPQRVLLPVGGQRSLYALNEKQRELRLSKQRTYGVDYDDDYDYMQHLKNPRDEERAVLVPIDDARANAAQPREREDLVEVSKDDRSIVKLPSVVFGSKQEEEIGMLHRAIPPKGPQPTWDPDVVAALDEDFDYNDPDNLLEDDFVLKALEAPESESETEVGSDFEYGDFPESDVDEEDYFSEEETKSRFTSYSMTSSVMRRNENLTHLDDRFEKLFETYDDDYIGDIPQVDIDGVISTDDVNTKQEIKLLLGLNDKQGFEIDPTATRFDPTATRFDPTAARFDPTATRFDPQPRDLTPQPRDLTPQPRDLTPQPRDLTPQPGLLRESDDDADVKTKYFCDETVNDSEDMIVLVKEEEREKWDCESILSTYSTLYNHPKLIEEITKPKIKLSQKTGIPITKQSKSDKEKLETLEENETSRQTRHRPTINVRPKHETKEEKELRKKSVKEARRERRQEKKATKIAFQNEKTRQSKEILNLRQNLSGVKIT